MPVFADIESRRLELRRLTKRFGNRVVIDDLDLMVGAGEFVSLLGPSGCGKSTILRMIAGHEHPDAGTIHLGGVDITQTPPNGRPVNMVFQSYALFPHLSVAENVAYPLTVRRIRGAYRADRVDKALDLVQLGRYADRMPAQLSGGEQQRTALARAIVAEPDVLLLDEPMSALDARLRESTRVELQRLHERLRITFLLVTHDQRDALTLADRIAVVHDGAIAQIGTPEDLYERPANRFVTSFVGDANLLDVEVLEPNHTHGHVEFLLDGVVLAGTDRDGSVPQGSATLAVRPHRIDVEAAIGDERRLTGVLAQLSYRGDVTVAAVELDSGRTITSSRPNRDDVHPFGDLRPGDRVVVDWKPEAAHVVSS